MKIRARITVGFLLVLGLGFTLLASWILNDLWPQPVKAMEDALGDTAVILASLVETDWSHWDLEKANLRQAFDTAYRKKLKAKIYELDKTGMDLHVIITDAKGIVLFDSKGGKEEGKDYNEWHDIHMTLEGKYGARTTRLEPDDIFSSIFYVAAPIIRQDEIVGVVSVGKPAKNVQVFVATARRRIIIFSIIIFCTTILLGFLLSSWITRPVTLLTRYARAVRDGRRVTLPPLGGGELHRLGSAFEEMRDTLEGKHYVEATTQNLVHEIKGPLASIRGAAELLEEEMPPERREQFLRNIRTESGRIQEMVDRFLHLASLQRRKGLTDVTLVKIRSLVEEVIEEVALAAREKVITFTTSIPDALTVPGERLLLHQAFGNILRNAVDFIPEEGTISVTANREGERISVKFTDTGVGIPDYARDRIFDRFYSLKRPGSKPKSTGLGLAVVREIMALHGGEVRIESSPEGGTTVTLTFTGPGEKR